MTFIFWFLEISHELSDILIMPKFEHELFLNCSIVVKGKYSNYDSKTEALDCMKLSISKYYYKYDNFFKLIHSNTNTFRAWVVEHI